MASANNHANPLVVLIPYAFPSNGDYPTEVLANRFQAWRTILKELVTYFKDYASVQEEIVRQQLRLQQAVSNTTIPTLPVNSGSKSLGSSSRHPQANSSDYESIPIDWFFLPVGNGSIQDLNSILNKYHLKNFNTSSKTLKDLNGIIIPKLEELRRDLMVKIKEIKDLHNDFKNDLGKELVETKHLLQLYEATLNGKFSVRSHESGHHGHDESSSASEGKNDPYLVKIKLERQLKRQVNQENDLYEAYANLQTAGGKLESIVVLEIQNYLSMFLNLVGAEKATFNDFLVPNIQNGFLAKEANFEWDSFIARNSPGGSEIPPSSSVSGPQGKFIDLTFPLRKASELHVPGLNSPQTLLIKEGTLERKSKYLKSYSSGYYVLTANFFHEFKTPDRKRDLTPLMSLPLSLCTVQENSKDSQFSLITKANGILNKAHKWVFRASTQAEMKDWFTHLKALTSLTTSTGRAQYIYKNVDNKSLHPILSNTKVSRSASIMSQATANSPRSIKSGSIAPDRRAKSPNLATANSSTINRNSTIFTQNGATSHRTTGSVSGVTSSPRLGNMINSDGTIITPIETKASQLPEKLQPHAHEPAPSQMSQHSQAQSQGQPAIPYGIPMMMNYSPQGAYYVANNPSPQPPQSQQFYDPVTQQVFTIVPQQLQLSGQPQQTQPQTVQQGAPTNGDAQKQFLAVPSSPGSQYVGYFDPVSNNGNPGNGSGTQVPNQVNGGKYYTMLPLSRTTSMSSAPHHPIPVLNQSMMYHGESQKPDGSRPIVSDEHNDESDVESLPTPKYTD